MNSNDWDILKRFGVTPDNLTVRGCLYLNGTGITALPDNLTVGGDLHLNGTGITALPDNLTVRGYLNISHTGITALPDSLTVRGCLDITGTGITALPDSLTVGGRLYLNGTGIEPLLRDARDYRLDRAGSRYIAGCRNFTAAEALAHWGSDKYPDQERGQAYCAAISAEESRRKGEQT